MTIKTLALNFCHTVQFKIVLPKSTNITAPQKFSSSKFLGYKINTCLLCADAISNYTMAKQGFPRMGIGACFGGPLLSILYIITSLYHMTSCDLYNP